MHHYQSLKVDNVNGDDSLQCIGSRLTHPGTLAISVETNTQNWHKENGKYLSETGSGSCMSIAVTKTKLDKFTKMQMLESFGAYQ